MIGSKVEPDLRAGFGRARRRSTCPEVRFHRLSDHPCRAKRGRAAHPEDSPYLLKAGCAATFLRSATSAARFAARSSGGPRRIDDGCTVAKNTFAHGTVKGCPRDCVTRNEAPINAWAAVAPSATTTAG